MSERDIRRVTMADIERVSKMNNECGLSEWSIEDYRACLESGDQIWVFENSRGELDGFVLARFLPPEMEILKLAVMPKNQRQGIGSLLLAMALAKGRERGCSECYLEVRKGAVRAICFYSRNGFRPVGVRRNYYRNPNDDAVVMRYWESRNE